MKRVFFIGVRMTRHKFSKNKKCAGGELSRLSVLVTASMTREKLPLLVDNEEVLRLSVI